MTLHLGTPQIVLAAILAGQFVLHCLYTGQPRGRIIPAITLARISTFVAILWWGGFWG